jgi:hypothetical protein
MEVVKRCYQYFDKNESDPIIKPHKQYYKQWSYSEKTSSDLGFGFVVFSDWS